MSVDFLDQIMSSWFGYTGDYTLIAIGILIFFLLAFVLVGIDFKFAMLFCLPLAAVMSIEGWFSVWFSVVFWILTVGIGGYLVWTSFIER